MADRRTDGEPEQGAATGAEHTPGPVQHGLSPAANVAPIDRAQRAATAVDASTADRLMSGGLTLVGFPAGPGDR